MNFKYLKQEQGMESNDSLNDRYIHKVHRIYTSIEKSFFKLSRDKESDSRNKNDINESSFNGEINYIDTSNNHEYFWIKEDLNSQNWYRTGNFNDQSFEELNESINEGILK